MFATAKWLQPFPNVPDFNPVQRTTNIPFVSLSFSHPFLLMNATTPTPTKAMAVQSSKQATNFALCNHYKPTTLSGGPIRKEFVFNDFFFLPVKSINRLALSKTGEKYFAIYAVKSNKQVKVFSVKCITNQAEP